MKTIFLLLVVFLNTNLSAQSILTGTITDSVNNPVPFASVYLANTTIGTSANTMGEYRLIIPNNGPYILSVNCIGYESYIQPIESTGQDLRINVRLRSKVLTLNEVTVSAKSSERKKNLARFNSIFLGETPNSRNCIIQNPEDLRLHYNKEKKMLSGYSVKPLIIENRSLGYRIIYDLRNFEHYSKEGITRYFGTPYFQQLDGTLAEEEAWKRSRLMTYYGSQLHFMRSLFADNIKSEQFEMYEYEYNPSIKANVSSKIYSVSDLRLVKKNDHIVMYASKPVYIYYDNPGLRSTLLTSKIFRYSSILSFKKTIKIYENGYFEDGYSVSWEGKMSEERMADMLPFDFQPDLSRLSSSRSDQQQVK